MRIKWKIAAEKYKNIIMEAQETLVINSNPDDTVNKKTYFEVVKILDKFRMVLWEKPK